MGLARDDRVTDHRTHHEPAAARRFGAGDAEVVPFRSRRESLAERLERERAERERVERERRERIERERAAREGAIRERLEQRRRARLEQLRREREAMRWSGRVPARERHAQRPRTAQQATPEQAPPAPEPPRAQVRPGVEGPVRKRKRVAENRRRAAARRKGLFWPTAKAGFAVTVVLGLSAAFGALIGLPVPGLDAGSGRQSLAGAASLFPLDPGTPPGLSPGYVFPI